MTCHFK